MKNKEFEEHRVQEYNFVEEIPEKEVKKLKEAYLVGVCLSDGEVIPLSETITHFIFRNNEKEFLAIKIKKPVEFFEIVDRIMKQELKK